MIFAINVFRRRYLCFVRFLFFLIMKFSEGKYSYLNAVFHPLCKSTRFLSILILFCAFFILFFWFILLLRLCMLLFLSRAPVVSFRHSQSSKNICSDVNYSLRPCVPLLVFVTCFLFSNYRLLYLRLNSCEALFFYCEAAAVARSVCEAALTIAKQFPYCEAQPVLAKQSGLTILAKRRMKLRSRFVCAKLSFRRSGAFAKLKSLHFFLREAVPRSRLSVVH